jgi:hypothetical protein
VKEENVHIHRETEHPEDSLWVKVWLETIDGESFEEFAVPVETLRDLDPAEEPEGPPESGDAGKEIRRTGARAEVRLYRMAGDNLSGNAS